MANDWFRFKRFTIRQEDCAMKVGTDGVLLGAWSVVPGSGGRVLDVGTGTGLIALMIAQRTEGVLVDALEKDPLAARQAVRNFRNSPWEDRIQGFPSSFQNYVPDCKHRYDLVICNPPFFSASLKAASPQRSLARHDDALPLAELFKGAKALMKNTGLLSFILPTEKEALALELMAGAGLYCSRLTRVVPAPGKAVRRILFECRLSSCETVVDELTIETSTRHCYSPTFRAMIEPFFLDPK
ncbi:MAG: tRNA (adenine-N(6)-)-methyltransferase [Bacteroidetes bacterium]|nr:MAG: tRNA (adenine-N(6)-)-methyltransferase [Bacteroidota bacterium]